MLHRERNFMHFFQRIFVDSGRILSLQIEWNEELFKSCICLALLSFFYHKLFNCRLRDFWFFFATYTRFFQQSYSKWPIFVSLINCVCTTDAPFVWKCHIQLNRNRLFSLFAIPVRTKHFFEYCFDLLICIYNFNWFVWTVRCDAFRESIKYRGIRYTIRVSSLWLLPNQWGEFTCREFGAGCVWRTHPTRSIQNWVFEGYIMPKGELISFDLISCHSLLVKQCTIAHFSVSTH